MGLFKYVVVGFLFLILNSCSEQSKTYPERKEILWNYNETQNIGPIDKYKMIYNINGCTEQTADSGFLFLYINTEDNFLKTFIKKFNSSGEIEWDTSYYNSGFTFNAAYDIVEDADKNIVFVGQQGDNAWVVKLDSSGNFLWEKSLESAANNLFTSVTSTPTGHYLISGVTYTDTTGLVMGHSDIWLMEVAKDGALIWETKYGKEDWDEFVYDVKYLSDNQSFVVSGYAATAPNYKGDDHKIDALLAKFDITGKAMNYQTTGGNKWDIFYSTTVDNEGNILCAGHTESKSKDLNTNGLADAFIVKFDSNLNIVWKRNYGGSYCDYAHKIMFTDDGHYLFMGTTQSDDFDVSNKLPCPPDPWRWFDGWLVKLNKDGSIIWNICYGGSDNDYGYCITKSTTNNVIIGLASLSMDGDVNYCSSGFWLSKLNINKIDSIYTK